MRKKSNTLVIIFRCLFVYGCLAAAPVQASIVNLTFVEDINGFSSTWRIDDNGGSDFSGAASVTGTYWAVDLLTDATPVLEDTIAHILGPHGELYTESSFDYGALPAGLFSDDSWVNHDGHRDEFSMTSEYVGGGYNVSIMGVHLVPIPAAVWLFGSGLGLLGWVRRRQGLAS